MSWLGNFPGFHRMTEEIGPNTLKWKLYREHSLIKMHLKLEINDISFENTTCQNLWAIAKVFTEKKFIFLSTYIINNKKQKSKDYINKKIGKLYKETYR